MSFAISVSERKAKYVTTSSDRFMNVFKSFFNEFIESFFPQMYNQMKNSSVNHVDLTEWSLEIQEYSREFIVVIETSIKGEETIIFLYVNFLEKSKYQMEQRMWSVYQHLYSTYKKEIIPIMVTFKEGITPNKKLEKWSLFDFDYYTACIEKKRWRNYLEQMNFAAIALLLEKFHFSDWKRQQIEMEILRKLVLIQTNPAERRLLYDFFAQKTE